MLKGKERKEGKEGRNKENKDVLDLTCYGSKAQECVLWSSLVSSTIQKHLEPHKEHKVSVVKVLPLWQYNMKAQKTI